MVNPRGLGPRDCTFKSCHPHHFKFRIDFVVTMAKALGDFGATLVVVVVQKLPLMESKPMGSLGWFAKPSVLIRV